MKRAFLQKEAGDWAEDFVFAAKYAANELGYEVVPCDTVRGFDFNYPDITKDICIGSVEFTEMFFEACGVTTPEYLGYPESLITNPTVMGRKVVECTVADLVNYDYPYFVKPSRKVKQFTGDVIANDNQMKIFRDYYDVDDNTELYMSGVVDFVSEYRCFVHNGELVGIKHYKGDFKVFPDVAGINFIKKVYEDDLTTKPTAYTIDVGVLSTGQTVLVELNDMWAIGSYGFDPEEYVRMIISRFRQMAFVHVATNLENE